MTTAARGKRYREYRWGAITGLATVIYLCVRGLNDDLPDSLLWLLMLVSGLELISVCLSAALDLVERLQAEARDAS